MKQAVEPETYRPSANYNCNMYRQEMMLLALRKKLQDGGHDEEEGHRLREEIARLEAEMGMD